MINKPLLIISILILLASVGVGVVVSQIGVLSILLLILCFYGFLKIMNGLLSILNVQKYNQR